MRVQRFGEFNPTKVLEAFESGDRRFQSIDLLLSNKAGTLLRLAIDLHGAGLDSTLQKAIIDEAKALRAKGSEPVVNAEQLAAILIKQNPKLSDGIRDLMRRLECFQGAGAGDIHDTNIYELVDRHLPRPRPVTPPITTTRRDPFELGGEMGQKAAYLLVLNGDRSVQFLIHKDDAVKARIAQKMPALAALRFVNENDDAAKQPFEQRLANWASATVPFDTHTFKVTDQQAQEFGKNVRFMWLDRACNILTAEEVTVQNNEIRYRTFDWNGVLVGSHIEAAQDNKGPRLDAGKLRASMVVEPHPDPKVREQQWEDGLSMSSAAISAFVGAEPGLVTEGASAVEIEAGTIPSDRLTAHVPHFSHDDRLVTGFTVGSGEMPDTRVYFKAKTLSEVYDEPITLTSVGLDANQQEKADKLTGKIAMFHVAVKEADSVRVGNKTLAQLYTEGATKPGGLKLDEKGMKDAGINITMLSIDGETSDQIVRVQLEKDWNSGAIDKLGKYSIEVCVKEKNGEYKTVSQDSSKGYVDARLRITDETWNHTPDAAVVIRVRRDPQFGKSGPAASTVVAEFRAPFALGFDRDFVNLEHFSQYTYMFKQAEAGLAAFTKSGQISAPEKQQHQILRQIISGEGYGFEYAGQRYRITTWEKAAPAILGREPTADEVKAKNYHVVQRMGEDGQPGAVVLDAPNAVSHTDVEGYFALSGMPNHNNKRLYLGERNLPFNVFSGPADFAVPEGAADPAKAKADALEASVQKNESKSVRWPGYQTPDKSRDGFKGNSEFAPKHLQTADDLRGYIETMKDKQAALPDSSCANDKPGKGAVQQSAA